LKARGAFEVEMEWAQGRLVRAVLKSSRGNPVRLRTAGPVMVKSGGKAVKTRLEGGLTVFETAVNRAYEIVPG
jgi:alpha-L-fucosidase 2